jgi:hypothetical protein
MADPALVAAAARNNAEWCDAFCRAHRIAGTFEEVRWWSAVRTPPLYPDVVTLAPGLDSEQVIAGADRSRGCSVKDSYADLDLSEAGFEELFRAEWLTCEPADIEGRSGLRWSAVSGDNHLAEWEAAWDDEPGTERFFPPALLADPAIAFLGGWDGDRIAAGAIANRSSAVIGISNVFARVGDLELAYAAAASAITEQWEPMPLVAYDHGEPLRAARRAGFQPIGELRVWLS